MKIGFQEEDTDKAPNWDKEEIPCKSKDYLEIDQP